MQGMTSPGLLKWITRHRSGGPRRFLATRPLPLPTGRFVSLGGGGCTRAGKTDREGPAATRCPPPSRTPKFTSGSYNWFLRDFCLFGGRVWGIFWFFVFIFSVSKMRCSCGTRRPPVLRVNFSRDTGTGVQRLQHAEGASLP